MDVRPSRLRPAAPLLLAAVLGLGCRAVSPCPAPEESCSGTCVSLGSDATHCGSCGNACAAGLTCVRGACGSSAGLAACAVRTGGAFVTFSKCGESAMLWVTDAYFIARAEALLAAPASPGAAVPRMTLALGTDCDPQWSWHVQPADPAFVASSDVGILCDACPSQVQADLSYYLSDIGWWCPSQVSVTAVDRR